LTLASVNQEPIRPNVNGGSEAAIAPESEQKRRPRRQFLRPAIGWTFWIVNLLALVGVCVWIFVDGQFPKLVDISRILVSRGLDGDWPQSLAWVPGRLPYFALLGLVAVGSGIGILVCLFVGAKAQRSVRSWLAFTVLVAAWLTLAVTWRELSWHSQASRMKRQLSGLDFVVKSLQADTPTADSQRPDLGPFMAYPSGEPRTLILLTTPAIGDARVSVRAIELAAKGGVRLQLAGGESGAWLEWQPPGTVPESFRGGLMTQYQLERSAPLADGWFLVRYRESF
jgi:hypothetical protein